MLSKVEEAIQDIKNGKMVIVVDDENRENEGDIIFAAEFADAAKINFLLKHAKGLICAPISKAKAKSLDLNYMVPENNSVHHTAFTVSIDINNGGTGISTKDRMDTLLRLADTSAKKEDFVRPGHIFPLIANDGGITSRPGHTEASIDLVKWAGLNEAAVICEIINDDGTMARMDDLLEFSKKFDMKIISIEEMIKYKKKISQKKFKKNPAIDFPSEYGNFKLTTFENIDDPSEYHLAIHKGYLAKDFPVLVRLHSECLTGDAFGSKRCDCGHQLENSLKEIEKNGAGVLVYLKQEGRGIGLINKVKAYELQDLGWDTYEANKLLGFSEDEREFKTAAEILKLLNINKVELLTNNPQKISELEQNSIEVVSRIPLEIKANKINLKYLETKRNKKGHMILSPKNDGEKYVQLNRR